MKQFERRSLELTAAQWQELERMAIELGAIAPTGPTAGQPSWRTMVKAIADGELTVKENGKMDVQTVIEHVAASIAEGIISGDDARRINADEGFTIDHTPDGQSWTRTEGLQLSDAQLEQAIALAEEFMS